MKNISKILLLSTSCIICYEARDVYASFISDTVPRSGIHIYTTQPHLTSDYPHLPARLVAESSPREAGAASPHRFAVGCSVYKGNAMLTSYLPQAQSGNRHDLNTPPKVGGVRGGVTSETSISLSSKSDNVSLTGLIPSLTSSFVSSSLANSASVTSKCNARFASPSLARELTFLSLSLKNASLEHFSASSPTQGGDYKKEASVCFITDAGNCSGNGWNSGDEPNTPPPPGPLGPDIPEIDPIIKCKELGYTQAASGCGTGYSPEGYCPFDPSMVKKCICSEECPHNYQKQPCGSGMIQTGETTPNCQKCYKCTACEDVCPNGYSLEKGVCNEASAYKTECGSSCYKIVSNVCPSGSLKAPEENENQKNKIVAYTNCKKPCFKSFSDVCPAGYSKISASNGKCYDTANTDFGTICRKEKSCCTPLSSERNCTYGEQSCSDGCGGTRTCCKSAPPRPTCRTCWHSCRYTSQKVNTNQTQHMAWCSYTTTCSDGSSRTGGGVHGYVSGVNNGGKMCYSPECDGLLKQAVINHINNGDYDGCE